MRVRGTLQEQRTHFIDVVTASTLLGPTRTLMAARALASTRAAAKETRGTRIRQTFAARLSLKQYYCSQHTSASQPEQRREGRTEHILSTSSIGIQQARCPGQQGP